MIPAGFWNGCEAERLHSSSSKEELKRLEAHNQEIAKALSCHVKEEEVARADFEAARQKMEALVRKGDGLRAQVISNSTKAEALTADLTRQFGARGMADPSCSLLDIFF